MVGENSPCIQNMYMRTLIGSSINNDWLIYEHTLRGFLLMLARLQTFSLRGVDAVPVDVEVDVSGGALPTTLSLIHI